MFLLNTLKCMNKAISYKMYEYSNKLQIYEEYSD